MNKLTPIFIKEPSGQMFIEPIWHKQLSSFHTKLKSIVGNNAVAYAWYYRCSNLPHLAFDIVKSKSCCKFTLSNPSQLTN